MPVYGKSYNRLLALKKKMDPEGFFCHSMFPRPHAPDEWDQLPPLTQARMRRAQAETERLRAQQAQENKVKVKEVESVEVSQIGL